MGILQLFTREPGLHFDKPPKIDSFDINRQATEGKTVVQTQYSKDLILPSEKIHLKKYDLNRVNNSEGLAFIENTIKTFENNAILSYAGISGAYSSGTMPINRINLILVRGSRAIFQITGFLTEKATHFEISDKPWIYIIKNDVLKLLRYTQTTNSNWMMTANVIYLDI